MTSGSPTCWRWPGCISASSWGCSCWRRAWRSRPGRMRRCTGRQSRSRPARRWRPGRAYLVLTGGHVPILRSFAMASLVTLGVVVGRRAVSMRGLALAAAGLVLIAPAEVVGVTFQMSFAAVAALIAGYEALRPLLGRLHGAGWRRVGAACGDAGADEPAGRDRVGAVRRLSFRPRAALLHRRQCGRGAADGDVGAAARHRRAVR